MVKLNEIISPGFQWGNKVNKIDENKETQSEIEKKLSILKLFLTKKIILAFSRGAALWIKGKIPTSG